MSAPQPETSVHTSWSAAEQQLMPILLACMTRILPSVMAASGGLSLTNRRVVGKLLRAADNHLLDSTPELHLVPASRRRRYWRALLEAMVEDAVVSFPHSDGRR